MQKLEQVILKLENSEKYVFYELFRHFLCKMSLNQFKTTSYITLIREIIFSNVKTIKISKKYI